MPTTIDTSTTGNATGPGGNPRVVIAPSDGSAIVCYANGSQTNLGTAQSPYTTWSTQLIGAATTRNGTALSVNSDDGVDVVISSPATGLYYFHYKRSVNSWSNDVAVNVDTGHGAALGGGTSSAWIGRDQQGRIWEAGCDSGISNPYQVFCSVSTDGGSTWAHGTPDGVVLGENNATGVVAAIIGNYLVIVYDSGSGGLSYRRADVHGASIGAWSAAAAVTGVSGISTASVLALAAIAGGTTGALAYSASGIKALVYDASTDTWGSVTTLSSASADSDPNLVPGASGTIYALWSQNAGTNNNALVYKGYSGSWDASATTIEASGADRLWVNGAYLTSGPKLGYIWTEGTASPWNVEWDTFSISSTINAAVAFSGIGGLTPAGQFAGAASIGGQGGLTQGGQQQGASTLAGQGGLSPSAQQQAAMTAGGQGGLTPVLTFALNTVMGGIGGLVGAAQGLAQVVMAGIGGLFAGTGTQPGTVVLGDSAVGVVTLADSAVGVVVIGDSPAEGN